MKTILLFAITLVSIAVFGQHNSAHTETPALQFQQVLSQTLSDPDLQGYKMESSILTIKPQGIDTVSHRHDCELFGYVLEGSVDVALVTKTPKTYKAGEMFYEKRNILHTLTRNGSRDKPARVLLIFLIKEGREGYTPEYGDKK